MSDRTGGTGLPRWGRRAAWPAICTVLVAAFLTSVLLQADGDPGTVLARGGIVTLTSLVAGVACVMAGRRAAGVDRWGWSLLGAGLWAATTGNAVWLWYQMTLPSGAPFPSIGDLFVVAMVPLSLAGAAALGGLGHAGVRVVLDGLIISASLLFLSWCTVLGPLVQNGAPSLAYTIITFSAPIGDVAMASMAFILLARADRRRRSIFAMVGFGMLALAIAETGFAYMMQIGAYSAGNLAMNGWLVGYLLIGSGALRSRDGAGTTDQEQIRTTSPVRQALPYVPLAVALVVGVYVDGKRGEIGKFAYLLTMIIVLLVVVRQLVALRDNVMLTRDLSVALEDVRKRESDLEHLASHDSLTGLPNRSLFHRRIEETSLLPPAPFSPAVLYIDLDGFKQVNDRLGHTAGDALLVAVAGRLMLCVRSTDTVARLGGDEFAILVTGVTTTDALRALAERVVHVVDEAFDIEGETARIGASVGVAWTEAGEPGVGDDLVHRADLAMYAAKTQGKRRYVCYDSVVPAAPPADTAHPITA
jgi:diguanylate cyclase (GGDEF)-like protein